MKRTLTSQPKLSLSIIDTESNCEGSFCTLGSIYVNGRMNGDLSAGQKISIGPNAIIKGNLYAKEIIIEGTVFGNIEECRHLIVRKTADISSDFVNSESCEIEPGAILDIVSIGIGALTTAEPMEVKVKVG
jgi:cytoskeletal protein CcmA (bactofilin family)